MTLAILGSVAAALVLAGFGTLLLARTTARRTTVASLRAEAEAVVSIVGVETPASLGAGARPRVQRILQGLRLQGIAVVAIGPAGRIAGDLPDGVTEADLQIERLRTSETVSGSHGQLVYAAAPEVRPRSLIVAILTRKIEARSVPGGWFALASLITLGLGALVARWVSGSLTRPLRRADDATRRIAGGDLSVRLPEPATAAHDELAVLTRSINSMAAGLERSRGLERQFLLSVSHDLRTPLTSIRGYAEAITDGAAVDPGAAGAVILSEARRLERLVGDLLDLAKLDSHRFSFDQRAIEVNEVVTDTADGFRPETEAAGVALVIDEDGERTVATVDPDRLAQVVANLVENALKFARSAIRVSTVPGPHDVAIVVADDGPGISADDLPHVFERLYVAHHHPARKESGSGLGLAIVRELVAGMGGTVHAESPIDRPATSTMTRDGPAPGGTRLVVRFPRSGRGPLRPQSP